MPAPSTLCRLRCWFIFTWLVGYGALLGPVLGIMMADYWLVRRTHIDVPELYKSDGAYSYRNGWNPAACIAFVLAVLPNLPSFLATAFPQTFGGVPGVLKELYHYAWFVGVLIAMGVYLGLMSAERQRAAQWAVAK